MSSKAFPRRKPVLKNAIVFDSSTREFILEALDKTVDKEGYIVERSNQEQRVLTTDGSPIRAKELAGIKKGSLRFFKSDLPSLLSFSDELE